jgi:hypothetical protein
MVNEAVVSEQLWEIESWLIAGMWLGAERASRGRIG